MLDQPAGVLRKAGYLSDVYEAHRAYKNALIKLDAEGLQAWEDENEDVLRIMEDVRRMKREIERGDDG